MGAHQPWLDWTSPISTRIKAGRLGGHQPNISALQMLYKILDWTTNHVHLANDLIMYNVLIHTRSFPPMPIQSLRLHQVSYRQSLLIIWTRTRSIRSVPSPTTSSPRRLSLRVARNLQQPRTRQRRALNEQHTTMALFPACPFATCGEQWSLGPFHLLPRQAASWCLLSLSLSLSHTHTLSLFTAEQFPAACRFHGRASPIRD